ncbi:MAG: ABC transporter ATP-binding protein [Dehalococcoidales bacterium]|jgi:ABC-type sugar transport system ATPase subunit|nr:ABC transporter ATP-binding protein [Dehalococcoidales bacterium]MDD4230032.1 ABC transporter ATP-binding protein [Dehalococcoidales bacterium]MDD4465378.1 ABC transporter ATP-binding protein [Dehalococcoidales bacterium]
MPDIELTNISRHICSDINLKIDDGELMVILGPSGSGKTTLLNVVSGLTEYTGSVAFNGKKMDGIDASRRKIGYLFQQLVLFPHMDVRRNIAYSLELKRLPSDQIEARVNELLKLTKIKHLASRYPKHLSGGEKQRVALARALALSPEVLLLDEPLSSLDLQTSKYLRMELRQFQKTLGITTIYVTHDLAEAEEIADRIAIIHNGKLQQVATPDEVFFFPHNSVVSDFLGAPNILVCQSCRELEQGVVEASCGALSVIVAHEGNSVNRLAFLPRDIFLSDNRPPGPGVNRFEGYITSIQYTDDAVRVNVDVSGQNLVAEVPYHLFEDMGLAPGKKVYLIIKLRRIRVYDCSCSEKHKTGHFKPGMTAGVNLAGSVHDEILQAKKLN